MLAHKSEIRISKSETKSNIEIQSSKQECAGYTGIVRVKLICLGLRVLSFEFVSDFWISDFGFRIFEQMPVARFLPNAP
jgi:hypothetical protein